MRTAVLADIHGNAPALRAVLAEVDRERPDAIVVLGDILGGPLVADSLAELRARPEPLHWISGNAEREAIAAFDGAPTEDDEAGRAAAWSARALGQAERDTIAGWPITLDLDGVRYCHGSPRRDDELVTRATPPDAFDEILAEVEEPLVVGGHTHQQFVRDLGAGRTWANAGSIGMPYEGRPGAFWMLVDDGAPELRETAYDLEAAATELRASGFSDANLQLKESLLEPVDPAWVTSLFERAAGRG
jgi:predicted phosphodiesterase